MLPPVEQRIILVTLAFLAFAALDCRLRPSRQAGAGANAPPPVGSPTAWLEPGSRAASPDERADRLIAALSRDEKLTLLTGYFGVQKEWNNYRFPEARPQSAGLVRGIPRAQFTPQWQSDAGSGVATQGEAPPELERTLLPSGINRSK
jgi:beta-glucosidase